MAEFSALFTDWFTRCTSLRIAALILMHVTTFASVVDNVGDWHQVSTTSLPTSFFQGAGFYHNNTIYVILSNSSPDGVSWKLNLVSQTWTQLDTIINETLASDSTRPYANSFAKVDYNNTVSFYSIHDNCNCDTDSTGNRIYKFDIETEKVNQISTIPMNTRRSCLTYDTRRNYVYFIGGSTLTSRSDFVSTVFTLNATDDAFLAVSYLPDLPVRISQGNCYYYQELDVVYYFGGWMDGGNTNQIYKINCSNPHDDGWELLEARLPYGTRDMRFGVAYDQIYLIGGYDPESGNYIDTIMIFDLQSETATQSEVVTPDIRVRPIIISMDYRNSDGNTYDTKYTTALWSIDIMGDTVIYETIIQDGEYSSDNDTVSITVECLFEVDAIINNSWLHNKLYQCYSNEYWTKSRYNSILESVDMNNNDVMHTYSIRIEFEDYGAAMYQYYTIFLKLYYESNETVYTSPHYINNMDLFCELSQFDFGFNNSDLFNNYSYNWCEIVNVNVTHENKAECNYINSKNSNDNGWKVWGICSIIMIVAICMCRLLASYARSNSNREISDLNPRENEIELSNIVDNGDKSDKCIICASNCVATVNIPCGHQCFCQKCLQQMTKENNETIQRCPVCRKQNIKVYNTYNAGFDTV